MQYEAEQSDAFKTIIDSHPNPCVVHINFQPLYANKAFAVFSGFESAADVLSLENLNVLFAKEHWSEAQRRYQAVIDGLESTEPLIIEHFDVNGNPQVAEITDTLIEWHGLKAMCTYISVVTDQVKREKLLHKMAMHDELTGAKNRRYLLQQFNNHNRVYVEGHHFLALIDLDHFKRINDTWGHAVGDHLLQAVAVAISNAFETPHHLTRIGGEEFAIILDANSDKELQNKLIGLQTAIQKANVGGNVKISCTASIGVANYQTGDSFESIFKRADDALYQAKSLGRNRVFYCSQIAINHT